MDNLPQVDPQLPLDITDAINHDPLRDQMHPVTTLWVKSRLKDLLRENYIPTVDWLANTLSRNAERDPLTNSDRMAIFLICSEIAMAYTDLLPKFIKEEALDDTEMMDNVIGWMRGMMTMGFILCKEGLVYDGESIPDKKES